MDTATELKASDIKCMKTFFGGGTAVVAGGGLQPLDAWTKMWKCPAIVVIDWPC